MKRWMWLIAGVLIIVLAVLLTAKVDDLRWLCYGMFNSPAQIIKCHTFHYGWNFMTKRGDFYTIEFVNDYVRYKDCDENDPTFGAYDNTDPTKRPYLTIVYPNTTMTMIF